MGGFVPWCGFFSSYVGNELVGVIYIERGYVVVQKASGAWLALS